jgi:hypothetical protein
LRRLRRGPKAITHPQHDHVRRRIDIGSREAQQSEARLDETILPAVIVDEPIAMVPAIKLDCQPLDAIEHIGSSDKAAPMIHK